jgi:hypothetical protein
MVRLQASGFSLTKATPQTGCPWRFHDPAAIRQLEDEEGYERSKKFRVASIRRAVCIVKAVIRSEGILLQPSSIGTTHR